MRRFTTTLIGLASVLAVTGSAQAQFASVGSLEFPTSGSPKAQQHFLRGVAILHSFGFKQAIKEFQAAQRIEPDFAMAYWGETLCYNHPLFADQLGVDEDSPRAVLARLAPTRTERLAKAPTDREKGFLNAIEILFGEGDRQERRVGYMEAMRRLHERYPDDPEVGAFYALSLLSGSRALADRTFRYEMMAGALALRLFADNADHPGAPHYAIHAFDDPIHAPLALPAALRYAEIAPAVSHARHMPTHIFIQHGMWDLVSVHNQSAYEAARALWQPGDSVGDTVHSLDWGQYGDLQRGDYTKARTWIERLETVNRESGGASRAASSLPRLKARYIVEAEEWRLQPITDESSPPELLATGMSAVRSGDLATAAQADAALKRAFDERSRSGDRRARDDRAMQIAQREVAALISLAKGHGEEAIRLMDEAIEIAERGRPPAGAANPVKPPYELYGEILLELDRPAEAAERFETSLVRMPNRPRSLLGSARAAAGSGDHDTAREQYNKLLRIWRDHDQLPGFQEASRFVERTEEP